jgi:hypothetical protein
MRLLERRYGSLEIDPVRWTEITPIDTSIPNKECSCRQTFVPATRGDRFLL